MSQRQHRDAQDRRWPRVTRPVVAAGVVGVAVLGLVHAWSITVRDQDARHPGGMECGLPQGWRDADVERHSRLIAGEALCLSTFDFLENRQYWRILVLDSRLPGPNWLVVHDDEDAAFDSALYAVVRYGGKVVAVKSRHSVRSDIAVDPNRNFALTADQSRTCGGPTGLPAPVFTSTVVGALGGPPFLALHNNKDGHFRGGGSGNVSVRHGAERLFGLPAFHRIGRLADEDNAIIISGLEPPSRLNDRMRRLMDKLRNSGINVIYEHVQEASNDCSLSNYLLLYGGAEPGQYFNIEAEVGDYPSQIAMVDRLVELLSEE